MSRKGDQKLTSRFYLFLVWLIGFAVCISLIFGYYFNGDMLLENLGPNCFSVIGIFSPYLTSIVAFWFVKDVVGHSKDATKQHFIIAILTSTMYILINIIIIGSAFFLSEQMGLIEKTLDTGKEISVYLSFLVGPIIGFYFGKVAPAE